MFRLAARLRAHLRNRTLGQSLVEFAIILPIMLVFLAAALDLGRVFYANDHPQQRRPRGRVPGVDHAGLVRRRPACNTATNLVVCRVQLETTRLR